MAQSKAAKASPIRDLKADRAAAKADRAAKSAATKASRSRSKQMSAEQVVVPDIAPAPVSQPSLDQPVQFTQPVPSSPPVQPVQPAPIAEYAPMSLMPPVALETLTGFNLPEALSVNLPDFQNLLTPNDLANPSSFTAAGWGRVTDEQREQDQRTYKELSNYAANLGDGIKTLTTMVSAATAGTKLGKALIQYAIGVQEMKTEAVNYQVAQRGTTAASMKLAAADRDIQHLSQVAEQKELSYAADIDDLNAKLDRKLRQIESTRHETDQRFPVLAVAAA